MRKYRLPVSLQAAILIFVFQIGPAGSQIGMGPLAARAQTAQTQIPAPQPASQAQNPSSDQNGIFALKPISTDNILTIIQICVIAVSLYVAARSLTTNSQGLRASTLGSLFAAGRELALNTDVLGPDPTAPDLHRRRDLHLGMLIAYYSQCYTQHQLIGIPDRNWRPLKAEMKFMLQQPAMRAKWDVVRPLYGADFQNFVEREVLAA
jgi:hypothetical protein